MLPLSPSTTYSAGTPPAIKAADLNDLQKYLAGIYSAGYTVKSLVADGTGGNATSSPPAGSVTVSAALSGNATPTTAVPPGQIGKGGAPLAWALIDGSGSLRRGYNIYSVTRGGPGQYLVVPNSSPSDLNYAATIVTPWILTTPNVTVIPPAGGKLQVVVQLWSVYTGPGSPVVQATDSTFSIVIFGE